MNRYCFWFFVAFVFWPHQAFGQKSCLPSYTALQLVETIVPGTSGNFAHILMNDNGAGLKKTRVQLRVSNSPSFPGELRLAIGFDPLFDGVSLPYNLYALMVVREGEVIGWWDFTSGCTESGLSFFPGREIELPTAKLIGDKPQKLQIMVWGRL